MRPDKYGTHSQKANLHHGEGPRRVDVEKRLKADLHTHTTASDGSMSPSKVVEWAKKGGLDVVAITDHDTVAGLAEGKKRADELGIKFVHSAYPLQCHAFPDPECISLLWLHSILLC